MERRNRLTRAGPTRANPRATMSSRSATRPHVHEDRPRENLHAVDKTHMTAPASGSSTLPGDRSGSVRVTRATYSAGGVASHPRPSFFFRTFAGRTCTVHPRDPRISRRASIGRGRRGCTRTTACSGKGGEEGGRERERIARFRASRAPVPRRRRTSAFTRHRGGNGARKCTGRPYF